MNMEFIVTLCAIEFGIDHRIMFNAKILTFLFFFPSLSLFIFDVEPILSHGYVSCTSFILHTFTFVAQKTKQKSQILQTKHM